MTMPNLPNIVPISAGVSTTREFTVQATGTGLITAVLGIVNQLTGLPLLLPLGFTASVAGGKITVTVPPTVDDGKYQVKVPTGLLTYALVDIIVERSRRRGSDGS